MDAIMDAQEYLQKKQSILYRATTIQSGESFDCGGFVFFRRGDRMGAAIPTGDTLVKIHNVHPGCSFSLDGDDALPRVEGNWLTLTIDKNETDISDPVCEEEFASRILNFVKTDDGARDEIIADPWSWAEKIIAMSGDKVSEVKPYPMIAELCLVNMLREAELLTDVKNQYRGPNASIHDFELPSFSLECKAHLHGDPDAQKAELVISSENQLSRTGQKPLYLVYCPMEVSGDLTIDSCVAAFGEPRNEIMEKVALGGFVEGDFSWMRPYHAEAEPLVFEINDSFPRITPAQFPGGRFPSGITQLTYSVSLKNLPSCPIGSFIEAQKMGVPPVFSV